MRLGVISDTHGRLRPGVLERLAGVERILHAGDVGGPAILDELSLVAPVDAVWGNTDGVAVRAMTREAIELNLGGLRFAMAHGHRVASFELLAEEFPHADVIVHGHSHVPRFERSAHAWFLNPGSAGPGGGGRAPSIAVADVADGALDVTHLDVRTGRTLDL